MTWTASRDKLVRESELLSVPFAERDEYLAAIAELRTSDTPRFEGRYVSVDEIAFEPKPVRRQHLPILIFVRLVAVPHPRLT